MRTILSFLLLASAVSSFSGCGEAALNGSPVSIPRVIINCQSAQCRTNASPNPLISFMWTTSGCTAPRFGETVTASTVSMSCNGTTGCYGEVNAASWINKSGSTYTIPAGTYSICACIDYTRTGSPWQTTCNTLGQKDNVVISTSTGLQMITTWTDN